MAVVSGRPLPFHPVLTPCFSTMTARKGSKKLKSGNGEMHGTVDVSEINLRSEIMKECKYENYKTTQIITHLLIENRKESTNRPKLSSTSIAIIKLRLQENETV